MSTTDVIVGTVGRAHGLHGEVYVNLRTDSPELRFTRGAVLSCGERALTVASYRTHDNRGVVRFDEVADRTGVEALVGSELVASVETDESPMDDDEFFDHQLIGLEVATESGDRVGRITRVDHLGFQDNLVVGTDDGERLIPFITDFVPKVSPADGRVIVAPIPGLLEDL
ncbi:MAG: ribosome maturation factor RimM [Propionibacteriaceae bacterium]|nr:ribosome maturation factor RimM [Propionibacteriaceae bacterium]